MMKLAGVSEWRWNMALVFVAIATRVPVFLHPFLNGDEATYAALANAMLDGHWLYVGAVDHKPPLIYVTYAGILGVFGRYTFHAVHAVSVCVVALTGSLLGSCAARAGLTTGAARIASALFVVTSAIGPGQDVLAANAELFMLLPSVAALAWLASAEPPMPATGRAPLSRIGVVGAGACLGLAALYKYQAAVTMVPALMLVWHGARARFGRMAAALLIGMVLPAAGVFTIYAVAGHGHELRFWAWTFPLRYAGALEPGQFLSNAAVSTLAWAAPLAALLTLAWVGWRYPSPHGQTIVRVRQVLLVWLAAAAIGVGSGGRFFLHYFLQMLPPLCVLGAMGAAGWIWTSATRRWITAGLVVPLVCFWVASAVDPYFRREVTRDTAVYRHVAGYLTAHAGPRDTLFVWGGSTQIYAWSRLPMGTRFVFCNYQTGKMWGTPADREGATNTAQHIVPETWPMLMEDMARRAPVWVVDAGEAGLDRWRGHPMARYPDLAGVIVRDYEAVARIDGATVYRRRVSAPGA